LSLVLELPRASAWQTTKTSSGKDIKWGSGSASYYINPAGGPKNSPQAVLDAMQTWSSVPTADFDFFGVESTSPCTGSYQAENGICFGAINEPGVVAQNSFWYNPATGEMLHSEIVFNTKYKWSIGGSASSFDVQNIITHELGHTLSLQDEYSVSQSANTMYGYASYNETKKRTLEADDLAGICYLYPSQPAPPAPPEQCSYTVTISQSTYAAAGGTGSVTVSTQPGCTWNSSSSSSWITMNTPSATSVSFTVAKNTSKLIRSSTISVANKSFVITQSANIPIKITASPSSIDFGKVKRNTTSAKKSSVVSISGNSINSIALYISGNNYKDFSPSATCVKKSSTSYTCTITSTFRPTALGAETASIDVYVNNGESTLSLPLKGRGL
jgi:hypothetical protein